MVNIKQYNCQFSLLSWSNISGKRNIKK